MRRLLQSFALGAIAGGLFLAALLFLDIGGLGTLILRDRAALVPIALLLVNLCGLFGIVVAVSSGEDRGGAGRRRPVISPNLAIERRSMKPAGPWNC